MTGLVLCVDLGGTTMRAAVVDRDGKLRLRSTEPTPRDARCPDALEQLIVSVRDRGGPARFDAVVIGVPGRVDYRDGHLEHAPNLPPTWTPELTEARLGTMFAAPVHLANDADLATVGECYFGGGAPYRDVVYVTISTGIGAGVVFDGHLVRGSRSLAEIGHTILSLEHLAHGEPATAEQLGAGPALRAEAQASGVDAEGAALVALVREGDAAARRVWDATMFAAAAAVVNLAHLFSPDVVVIGGGLGRNGALVHDPVREMLERRGPQGLERPIVLVEASLGDDAGLVGGAAWLRAV